MSFDTEVLIIGAGMSGLGLAVQLIRQFNVRSFELIEKAQDVGGTWLVNTYPGCGCDVASHFYSYSFALNPSWTRKYSMQPEIQAYFRSVAEQYKIVPHIRFHSIVEKAIWDDKDKVWIVTILDVQSKTRTTRRAKALVSAVGSLSVPKTCEIPGQEKFKGQIWHSASWNWEFDWQNKDIVVLGNGCSATQFLPIMANGPKAVRKITQFARQAQYLSSRTNPYYSPLFKTTMRYVPFVMRIYRAFLYAQMERDYSGFDIESGRPIRAALARENAEYVKQTAPKRYWDVLIPKSEIGCKRKVLDTEYLSSLWNENVELVTKDQDEVVEFDESGVKTRSGRHVDADAVVLATGFQTQRMLWPMEIIGSEGIGLNEYWDKETQSVAQAYFGTCVPGFPNFFILMGPNTVTGHLSVIYTVECQINFTLRLLTPILKSLPSYRASHPISSLIPTLTHPPTTVEVTRPAALRDHQWTQSEAKKLVWSSGCVNWAVDPKTGLNNMMYPDWQFLYWWRSIWWKKADFVFKDGKGEETSVGGGMGFVGKVVGVLTLGAMVGGIVLGKEGVEGGVREVGKRLREFDLRVFVNEISGGRV